MSEEKPPTQLTIGDEDAAIVVKKDGSFEAVLHNQNEMDVLTPANELVGLVMFMLSDEVTLDMVRQRFMAGVENPEIPN